MRILDSQNISKLVHQVGLKNFLLRLTNTIKEDYTNWSNFSISPRHASHYPKGVIELMPTTTDDFYAFKYVNGHPINTTNNKLSIIAFGALSDTHTGLPLLLADMTYLTALRTAATSALAMSLLAKKDSNHLSIIGTGAQSEYQALALHYVLGISNIKFFDIDPYAMKKFQDNLSDYNINLQACHSIEACIEDADIITTSTAAKQKASLLSQEIIPPGATLNCIGGDCPGKTELNPNLLKDNLIVVEFLEQAIIEGEIQNTNNDNIIQLWEILKNNTAVRKDDNQIIIFDSVGIAIEDYSALKLTYQLANEHRVGDANNFLPTPEHPKNLFGEFMLESTVSKNA